MRLIDADKLHFSPRFARADPDSDKLLPVLAVDKGLVDLAPTESQWISVEDRLPEDMGDVLVRAFWHEKWGVRLGWYSHPHKCWHIFTPSGDHAWIEVTHWMPLPEPPKEGAEG